jgi:hypothetical protein
VAVKICWWLSDVQCLWALQPSKDILADADILYDRAAVFRDTMKGTACVINLISKCRVTVVSSAVMGYTLKERALVAERFML